MDAQSPILLTGASGFIGSRLAARMVAEGRRVRCLLRPSSDTTRSRALPADGGTGGIELVIGDLANSQSLRRAAGGCAQVVHSAAMASDWGTVQEIRAANVTGAAELARAAVAAGARRFVQMNYRVAFSLAVAPEEGYRMLRRLTGVCIPPLLTRAAVQILGVDQDFSDAKLRGGLGWRPGVDYEHGLAATVAWLRDDHLPSL